MGIAVAIELLHNAFLVHDDVADGSEMRRGRPTLATTHGMAAALNAGDGLAIVAGQVLRKATRDMDTRLADQVWHEFDTMACARLRVRRSKPVGNWTMSRGWSRGTISS
jgi:geranylgeranyl diphosphate synthase, type II